MFNKQHDGQIGHMIERKYIIIAADHKPINCLCPMGGMQISSIWQAKQIEKLFGQIQNISKLKRGNKLLNHLDKKSFGQTQ